MKQPRRRVPARTTVEVNDEVFKQVYDAPGALPGKYRWLTSEADVRAIEKLLGLDPKAIGAPLWVSGDTRHCDKCGRETNWLDIVSSALAKVHNKATIAKVILGKQKFVNVEVPRAIADLACYKCKTPVTDLRSFSATTGPTPSATSKRVLEKAGLQE